MFRLFTLLCAGLLFVFSAAAQDVPAEPETIKATPDILALYDQALQALSQTESNSQAGGLFQLLGFAVNFEDKAPAQRAVDALLNLASSFESEEIRSQLYEGVANALCDMERYPEAVGVVNRISDAAGKYQPQFDLAINIVRQHEQNPELQPFDASELLRQAVAGAAAAKNENLELIGKIFLARELARQGKKEESFAVFAEVFAVAQKIKDAATRNDTIGVLFQSQVQYGQMDKAAETLKLVTDPEHQRLCIGVLVRHEKYAEAAELLEKLPVGELKDSGNFEYAVAVIKTISNAQIDALAKTISSEEQRKRFIQRMIIELQRNGREDFAVELSKNIGDQNNAKLILLLGEVETLVTKKQFAEAQACVEKSGIDAAIRQHFVRQILMAQYREKYEDSVAAKIAETYTSDEKLTLSELAESAKQTADIKDSAEKIDVFFEVLQGQLQLLDIAGAKQTIKLIFEQLGSENDIRLNVQYRLLLARLQGEMGDKQGVKNNIVKLLELISAVKDLNELKVLLPEESSAEPPQPDSPPADVESGAIKLDMHALTKETPVDEPAIQNQLFQIYFTSANLLKEADADTEAAAAFEKAKELADADPAAERKAEKLLVLAQSLAEGQ